MIDSSHERMDAGARKAGGVYYTPTHVVERVVRLTIDPLLEGKTPRQVARLRVLDPACGAGALLLGAYRRLLDWHRDRYLNDGPAKHRRELREGAGGEWRLSAREKRRILLNNIHGVDIDAQAVEVAKLSLLLEALEGEGGQKLDEQPRLSRGRALADLASNIKCGNALVSSDFYEGRRVTLDEEEQRRVNVFDWEREFPDIMRAGGFDALIVNPPYGAALSRAEADYLLSKYKLQNYRLDTYLLFMEKALDLVRPKGLLGFITPNTWLLNLQSKRIRRHLFDEVQIKDIVHYRYKVFPGATVDTEITVIKKESPAVGHQINVSVVEKGGAASAYKIPQEKWKAKAGAPVNIFERPEVSSLADKLRALPALGEVCVITQGAKPFQVGKGKPPQTRGVVDAKPFVSETRRDETFRPLLRGSLIRRYEILWAGDYWISFGDWLAEPRRSASYDAGEKILIRQTGDSLVATLDRRQFVVRDNLYTIVSRGGCDVPLPYLLGLINSRLLNWFYQTAVNPERGEALAQVKRGHVAQLPVALPPDPERRDRLVRLVERLLALHSQLPTARTPDERTRLRRLADDADRQLDTLVYELYGLTDDEIKIVKGATD